MQRKQFPFSIENASIETVVALSQQIPEFADPYGEADYEQRLANTPHQILAAYHSGQPIGFKVGYAREDYFYSWMGAVLPAYREQGIAKALAARQETWAREQGFTKIRFKTRNYLRAMLHFGIANDFNIIAVIPQSNIKEYRIVLEKEL